MHVLVAPWLPASLPVSLAAVHNWTTGQLAAALSAVFARNNKSPLRVRGTCRLGAATSQRL
jgi:hypothetical protein